MTLLLQSAAATDNVDDDDDKLMIPFRCSSAITVWTTVSVPGSLSCGRLTVQIILNNSRK